VPDGNYAQFIEQVAPDLKRPGSVVTQTGTVIGTHLGVHRFTIGQRKGLGVSPSQPLYVIELRPESAEVVVGHKGALGRVQLTASTVNWVSGTPPVRWRSVAAQIRHRHTPAPARVRALDRDAAELEFEQPQNAVTPGQAVVFYDADEVVGGGWID
jgi:tRNA-specific 2-thiouridylase